MVRKEENRGPEIRREKTAEGQSHETGYKKKQTTEIRQSKREGGREKSCTLGI